MVFCCENWLRKRWFWGTWPDNMQIIKRHIVDILPPVLGVCLVLYLIFHIISGERGLLAYPERLRALEAAKAQLVDLQQEQNQWEQRVRLLRMEGLDLDMLEERSRAMLNFMRSDEVVILLKPKN